MDIKFFKNISFGDLDFGDVFIIENGDFFIKIKPIEDVNAIDLVYGGSYFFDGDLEVRYVNASLVVDQ